MGYDARRRGRAPREGCLPGQLVCALQRASNTAGFPLLPRFPADEQHTHTMNVEVNQTKVRPRRGLAAAGMTAPEQEARSYDKVALHGEKVGSCRKKPCRRRLYSCIPARPQPPGKPSPSQCMTWKRDTVTLGVLTFTALALRFYMIWCVFERHADDATTS